MLFESQHSLDDNEFFFGSGKNMVFFPHLHQSFEFFLVTRGQAQVKIDGKDYCLKQNQAVLIFPYQVHSYCETEYESEFLMCIFSPWLVPSFHQKTKRLLPLSNQFFHQFRRVPKGENIFLQKAFAYEICGIFDQTAEYTSSCTGQKNELLTQLLLFISQNYKSECLLKQAVKQVRYDYVYLSKFFKRTVGVSFHSYVNQMRLQEARRLMQATDQPIAQVAEECGFSSLRTFYREFKHFTGITPMEYKKRNEAF